MSVRNPLLEAVEKVLADVNVLITKDGGTLELADVTEEGLVRIRLKGLCADCTESMPPIVTGIKRVIREQVPEVKEVIIFEP